MQVSYVYLDYHVSLLIHLLASSYIIHSYLVCYTYLVTYILHLLSLPIRCYIYSQSPRQFLVVCIHLVSLLMFLPSMIYMAILYCLYVYCCLSCYQKELLQMMVRINKYSSNNSIFKKPF